ncbi:hypothetical protein LXL04_014293 [Taraxacum kok-saghyz]
MTVAALQFIINKQKSLSTFPSTKGVLGKIKCGDGWGNIVNDNAIYKSTNAMKFKGVINYQIIVSAKIDVPSSFVSI